MSKHGDRRHHHTDVTVGARNSAGAAIGSGLRAVFQVWVNHHWATLYTATTAPYSVRVTWPRRDRGKSWTVRAVVSGAGYQTASTAIRVRGV
jgi:ribosomal protein S9